MENDERKKETALRASGTFNPRAERVTDTLFTLWLHKSGLEVRVPRVE